MASLLQMKERDLQYFLLDQPKEYGFLIDRNLVKINQNLHINF